MKDRRVMIVSVSAEVLLNLLADPSAEYLQRVRFAGLPEGCEVQSVRGNWGCRTIDLLVSHPSFPEVPDGEYPPRHDGVSREVYRAARLEDCSPRLDENDLPVFVRCEQVGR